MHPQPFIYMAGLLILSIAIGVALASRKRRRERRLRLSCVWCGNDREGLVYGFPTRCRDTLACTARVRGI